MGHMGGLIGKPRPGRGQCRASFSNTDGPPKPRKRAPCPKKMSDTIDAIQSSKVTDYHVVEVDSKLDAFYILFLGKFSAFLGKNEPRKIGWPIYIFF